MTMPALVNVDSMYAQLALPTSPTVVDVRSNAEYEANPRMLPGARRRDPHQVGEWASSLPRERAIAIYDSNGGAASRSTVQALAALGCQATYLEGGLDRWMSAGRSTVRARPEFNVPGTSRWVTRERPKIDRLACPWLIRRFIDPDALFFYTPAQRVRAEAEALRAQPYDIADVTFSHRGPHCSFDAFLVEFDLHDESLDRLADIVRAADTGEPERSPQAHGLLAISLGLSATIAEDVLLLEQAMPLYDALYAWCKIARNETHSWPKKVA
jgi:rhodanese-related sulfurtransferase